MSILSIVHIPMSNPFITDHCLRQECHDVSEQDIRSTWMNKLLYDMFQTLYAGPSGIGLSANQVGVLKKVCIIDIKRDGKKPLVLFNPSYESADDELTDSSEVCLSVPDRKATVSRYKSIVLTYQDTECNFQKQTLTGFIAIAAQHEIDHLYGKLYIDLLAEKDVNLIENYEGYHISMAKKAMGAITNE